jgi:ABC-type spermidine/putrescine transport system permease subunit II
MVTKKRLDFWFWVKLLVIGFMLVFLIYPFCTLITRSFFSAKRSSFPWKIISVSLRKNIITLHWAEACSYPV